MRYFMPSKNISTKHGVREASDINAIAVYDTTLRLTRKDFEEVNKKPFRKSEFTSVFEKELEEKEEEKKP